MLASGCQDGKIRLWDVRTGETVQIFPAATQVWAVNFSPDGRILATGSVDSTIKLWDVGTGNCLKTLTRERAYEGMNIKGAIGITDSQKATLKALGAVEGIADLIAIE